MKKMKENEATIKEDEEWRIKSDMRTIMEAMDIIRDEERMAKVRKLAKKQSKELSDIADEEYLRSIGLGKK